MAKPVDLTPPASTVQVFELTMDNPENQDELNRQLRKADEPEHSPPANAQEIST